MNETEGMIPQVTSILTAAVKELNTVIVRYYYEYFGTFLPHVRLIAILTDLF